MQTVGAGEVEVRFIQGGHDDGGRKLLENPADGTRRPAVVDEVTLVKCCGRAQRHGSRDGHAGVDAVSSGSVGRGLHHPTLVATASYHEEADMLEKY